MKSFCSNGCSQILEFERECWDTTPTAMLNQEVATPRYLQDNVDIYVYIHIQTQASMRRDEHGL